MALEKITEKITAEATEQVERIMADAKLEAEKIHTEFRAQLDRYREEMERLQESNGEALKRGVIIEARQALRNRVLASKRAFMQKAEAEAKKDFVSSKDYAAFMENALEAAVLSKSESLQVSAQEKHLNEAWLQAVNKKLSAHLTLSSEKGSFSGGILVGNQNVATNITVDALFAEVREGSERALAQVLFEE